MKALGYLLITAGFLAGCVFAVQTAENEVQWSGFVPAFVVGVVGVVLARVGTHRAASHKGKLSGDFATLTSSIDKIVKNVAMLDAEKEGLDPYTVHGRIDAVLREDLVRFADARESVGYLHSLADYAEVMNAFAAGERYLNRVWSASIDGWIDELQESLGRSLEQFRAVQSTLHALEQRSGGGAG